MRGDRRGFSTTELLIVVGIIGVLATIAIPALTSAVQRGKQKRSMADLRAIAAAIESYATDVNAVPVQAGGALSGIAVTLEPTYLKTVPDHDAWGRDFLYSGVAVNDEYTLTSLGRDGAVSGPSVGPTVYFDDDIIYSNGVFITWPEGTQQP